MSTDNKSAYMTYLTALASAPAPQPNAAPDPVISSAGRRDQYIARLTPLKDRLRVALEKFPRELLEEGVHMSQLWGLALGRQRSRARAFEVAQALRELGWQRIRVYSGGTAPSGSFWFPPQISEQDAKQILRGRTS